MKRIIAAAIRLILIVIGVSLTALPVHAGDPLNLANIRVFGLPSGGTSKVAGIIVAAINILLGLVSVLALAALIWGGIKYITSFGDEGETHKAKSAIKYAIIGLLVAGASFVIIRAVMALLS